MILLRIPKSEQQSYIKSSENYGSRMHLVFWSLNGPIDYHHSWRTWQVEIWVDWTKHKKGSKQLAEAFGRTLGNAVASFCLMCYQQFPPLAHQLRCHDLPSQFALECVQAFAQSITNVKTKTIGISHTKLCESRTLIVSSSRMSTLHGVSCPVRHFLDTERWHSGDFDGQG